MNKYSIEIEEILTRTVTEEADSIEEAIYNVEDKIDSEEIVLTADDFCQREIKNYNSWIIDKPLKFLMAFNPDTKKLLISSENSIQDEYTCNTVRDINWAVKSFLDEYIEKKEIEKEEEYDLEK